MPTAYPTLCRLEMRHDYFTTRALASLTATPTPATAERMRRAGLLFRARPDGFALLYTATDADNPLPNSRLVSIFLLLFGLTTTDPYFTNYTNLPLVLGPEHTYCLSPAPNAPLGPIGADQLLPLRPLQYSLPLPVPYQAGTAQLLSYPPGPAPPVWPVPATAGSLSLDLRPWGNGRYLLRLNNQNIAFYADDFLYGIRPWGLLEIGADVLTAGLPPPSASPPLAYRPPVYTLDFEARATYWQYQFAPRTTPLTDLRIASAAPLKFSLAEPLAGATASLRSNEKIKLAQRYNLGPFKLFSDAAGTAPTLLIPVLPLASPTSLRPAVVNQETLYISDIFAQAG